MDVGKNFIPGASGQGNNETPVFRRPREQGFGINVLAFPNWGQHKVGASLGQGAHTKANLFALIILPIQALFLF